MKKFIGLFALFMVLVLAACGNSEELSEEATDESAAGETEGDSNESGEMVTYTTDAGEEIEIPEDPQR
ncbi:hypothetical protein K6L05_14305, partial [Salinicoccus roseus]|nr:hypothetical protein [Salinicoccus roseus]